MMRFGCSFQCLFSKTSDSISEENQRNQTTYLLEYFTEMRVLPLQLHKFFLKTSCQRARLARTQQLAIQLSPCSRRSARIPISPGGREAAESFM
jgi:hypothetical protein